MPGLDAVAAEVREWFEAYFDTFRSLAAGGRADPEALLSFYGVSLVVVSDDRYVTLPDHAAVIGFATTMVA